MRNKDGRTQRVLYLRAHPELWQRPRREVLDKLREVELLSPKTSDYDVNLYRLMFEASGQRRVADRFSRLKGVKQS